MDLSMNFCPWTSMVSAVKARGRRDFDKRRFVHGRGRRGFSNAVVVHVHGLRVFAVDPEPWIIGLIYRKKMAFWPKRW